MYSDTWHIGMVQTGREESVRDLFPCAHVYTPMRADRRFIRRQRKWGVQLVSLFPGYIFVNFEKDPSVLKDVRVPGFLGLLRNGDRSFATLSERGILAVKLLEEKMRVPEHEEVRHPFRKGEQVEFEEGPFEGMKAIVQWSKSDEVGLAVLSAAFKGNLVAKASILRLAS